MVSYTLPQPFQDLDQCFYSTFPFRSNFSIYHVSYTMAGHADGAHATCVCRMHVVSQWKIQWEAKKGPGSDSSYSKATETSTGESMSILSSHSSGGAVASSSFSGVWSTTTHQLAGMMRPGVSLYSLSLSLSLSPSSMYLCIEVWSN